MSPRRHRTGRPSARVWALTVTLFVLGALLAGTGAVGARGPLATGSLFAPVLLWAAYVVAEVCYVQVIVNRHGHGFTLAEIPLVLGLWFLDGPVLLAAQVSAVAGAYFVHRGHRGVKLFFNVANILVQSAVAVTVFHALEPGADPQRPAGLVATLVASVAAAVVAAASVSIAIALHQGRVAFRPLVLTSLGVLAAAVATTSVGLIAVILLSGPPMAALLLLPPATVLVLSYRSVVLSRGKQESLEFLYAASRILHRGATEVGPATELLELARETFGAEVAELTLYNRDDPRRGLRTSVGPGDLRRLEPVDVQPEESPHEPDTASGATMEVELAGERRRLGRMVVAQPGASRRSFSPRERQLFITLANQVAVALENGALEASLVQVTALKEQLQHRAFHDELTGLPNRAMFIERLRAAVGHASEEEQPAVLFIDLDDFKGINDTLGHAAGDELLREVAERLRRCTRPGDLAVRLGGDEFAVLIVGSDSERGATLVAERLLSAMCCPITLAGTSVDVAASVGLARGTSARDPEELLKHADMAMYLAKANGKNQWAVFDPALHEQPASAPGAESVPQRRATRGRMRSPSGLSHE